MLRRHWFQAVFHLAAAAMILTAVSVYFGGYTDMLGASGSLCFRYFTTDSNLLAAVGMIVWCVCLVLIKTGRMQAMPGWVLRLRYAGTTAACMTMVMVCIVLAPLTAIRSGAGVYFRWFENNALVLHLLGPAAALMAFLLTEDEPLRSRDRLTAALPTVIYAVVYFVCVVVTNVWPDFYGFTFGGQYQFVPVVMLVMFLFSLGVSLAVRMLSRIGTTGSKPGAAPNQ